MNTPWQALFMKVGASRLNVYANWSMSTGARFLFAIPSSEKAAGNRFSEDVEFPFAFEEICKIEVPQRIGKGNLGPQNDLESIVSLFPIPGLELVQMAGLLTIRPVQQST